jgi:hypothetical protein
MAASQNTVVIRIAAADIIPVLTVGQPPSSPERPLSGDATRQCGLAVK